MKKYHVFVFLLAVFSFASCDPHTYYYMPEENKPLLVNNDTVLFVDSLTQKIDTFNIKIFDDYFISDNRSFAEYIVIRCFRQNKLKGFKEFYIFQPSETTVMVSVDSYNYSGIYLNIDQSYIIKNDITIKGKIYPTVYVLKPSSNMPDTLPNVVYYTYKYGIVRYDYSDGRKYELMSETVAKK